MRAGMWRRASTSALLGVRKSAPHAYTFARALSTKVKTEPHPFESFISGSSGGCACFFIFFAGEPTNAQTKYYFPHAPAFVDRSLADMEDMYHSWKADPESVHVSWRSVFARMDAGALPGQSFVPPPSLNAGQSLQASAVPAGGVSLSQAGQEEVTKVMQLINAYQARGHNVADLDPLGMYDADLDGSIPPDLELDNYGFTEADLNKEYQLTGLMQSGFLSGQVRSSREQAAAASGSK